MCPASQYFAAQTPEMPDFPASLSGRLLVAMPGTLESDFAQSVILICAHTPEGAMGLMVNRPLEEPGFTELLEQLNVAPSPPARGLRLVAGGPVDHDRGFVLHSADWVSETSVRVNQSWALTASLDILQEVAAGRGPLNAVLALGYAGWGPGQLDEELQKNYWLVVPATPELLFDHGWSSKWRRALATLKIDPASLSVQSGRA